MSKPAVDIDLLTRDQRLELIEQLWDSLRDEDLMLTDAQREELDRRLDRLDREGPVGIAWGQVRAEMVGSEE